MYVYKGTCMHRMTLSVKIVQNLNSQIVTLYLISNILTNTERYDYK